MGTKIPAYRLHKARHSAVVTINGKDHYLGPYGSAESREKYGRLIAQHSAGVPEVSTNSSTTPFSINAVVLAFIRHAKKHYRKAGKLTDEYSCFKSALRPLLRLYGKTTASGPNGFTAAKLRAVQDGMIELGWSRKYINKSIGRLRKVFRFAHSRGMLGSTIEGAAVLTSLDTLEPLLAGRSDAVELPERAAVPQEHIDLIRSKVNSRTRDMIDLSLLVGCRPGELVSLTTEIIDRSGDVWTATLDDHKMKHKGKLRVLAFGPKAQLILRKYLSTDRKKRLFPIRRDTFSKTLAYWCDKLGLPKFTAHWLRHNAGTAIRRAEDLDAAQALLGHADQRTTQIYAHLEDHAVVPIARKHG